MNIEIVFAAASLAPQVFDKSYKGSNLALMVELLAGPLVGAAVADKLAERNWGNLVVALDPGLMGDRGLIRERMTDEQRAAMMAHMPPPALEMWTGFGEQAFKEYSAVVEVPVANHA